MEILHLSADFPDPLAPAKTRAVSGLLELVPEYRHWVYSLNRVGWRRGMAALPFDGPGEAEARAVTYGAPPKGLMLRSRLAQVADFVLEDVAARGLRPALVHAHKLSVEGLAGARIAAALGVPLIVSSQGDSDLKIIGARRDLRGVWAEIWREAAVALPFAPWTAHRLNAVLGARRGPTVTLPCPTTQDGVRAPRLIGPRFRSVFHLGVWRRKNADTLIAAAGRAVRVVPDLTLEIHGGGDAAGFAALSEIAASQPPGAVRLTGPVPHGEMGGLLNDAGGFALPSRRESFGMASVEALLAGTPALHPRGFAIDGYLEDCVATLAVDAGDAGAVADGLIRLAREEKAFKTRLADLQTTGALEMFRRGAIATAYRDALARAVAAGDSA